MKYFVSDNERKNTVYHEFQKGSFDGHTFWKSDSISISDDDAYCKSQYKYVQKVENKNVQLLHSVIALTFKKSFFVFKPI